MQGMVPLKKQSKKKQREFWESQPGIPAFSWDARQRQPLPEGV